MNYRLKGGYMVMLVALLLTSCAAPISAPSNNLKTHILRQQAEITALNHRIQELEYRLQGVRFRVTPNTVQALPLSGFGQ